MQNAKEKMSNMASAVKENTNIYRAKAEEKVYYMPVQYRVASFIVSKLGKVYN